MKRLLPGLAPLGILLMALFLSISCSKEESDYQLTVVVTVDDGDRVANAFVRVYAPVNNSKIDFYNNTDENGEFDYSFDNEVVVEIIATKSGFRGCNFAEVKRGSNIVEVKLKPFGDNNNGCLGSN